MIAFFSLLLSSKIQLYLCDKSIIYARRSYSAVNRQRFNPQFVRFCIFSHQKKNVIFYIWLSKYAIIMVQIFKTNVTNKKEAKLLAVILSNENPEYKINFDLDDCDNILRIENFEIANHKVIFCLERMGYTCEVLF